MNPKISLAKLHGKHVANQPQWVLQAQLGKHITESSLSPARGEVYNKAPTCSSFLPLPERDWMCDMVLERKYECINSALKLAYLPIIVKIATELVNLFYPTIQNRDRDRELLQ